MTDRSEGPSTPGKLSLVATPIGNLEDITLRALRVLKEADLIAAEDTRHTRKLMSHFDLHADLVSFYQQVEHHKIGSLLQAVSAGKRVAVVSDAGMPGISDPGQQLVAAARTAGIEVEIVPGASAVITALVGSGLPTAAFSFQGFLPAKPGERQRCLESLKDRSETQVFFLSPHRLASGLSAMAECWGDRPAVLARELTKLHEEYLTGTLTQLVATAETGPVRGEYTLVVAGAIPNAQAGVQSEESLEDHLRRLQSEGLSLNQAIARAARERGLPRAQVYTLAHAEHRKSV